MSIVKTLLWKLCVALVLLGAAASQIGFAEILKGPYLQNVKTDGITIMWESDRPTTGIVLYGRTPDYGMEVAEKKPARIHEIHIRGLEVESLYHYKVLSGRDASVDRTFQTAVRPDSPFRVVYYGDNKTGPHMHRKNALRISAERPHIVLQCGDLVNQGYVYSQWSRLFFAPASVLIDHVPLYPSLGNHEQNAEYYFQYFSLPHTESWYSFDYGNAHFVVLDSNSAKLREGSAQVGWLIEDLKSSQAPWKFVSFHHPPFTAGGNHYTLRRIELKNLLHPIFEKYGVDIVFNGHDHNYERTLPIVSKQGARPVTYVVSGNGGTPLRYVGRRSWTAYSQRVFGYTLLRLDGQRLELEGKTVDGEVIDRLVIDKGDLVADKKYVESALAFESIVDPVEAIRLGEEGEDLAEEAEDNGDKARAARALEKFKKAFELDPTAAEVLVEMGKLNRVLGREKLAIQQFNQAMKLLPVYPDSYEELIEIYTDQGKYDKAMRLAKEWAKVEPDQTDPQEAMAEIWEEQGKPELAILHLKKALEIVPSDSGVHVDLALLYEKLGRKAEARTHYQEAMEWLDAEDTERLQKLVSRIVALK
jgi:tetratricopeptide (TPR) repeat protein